MQMQMSTSQTKGETQMEIFPAIDIKDGRVVRLTQGDYDRVTVYDDDPVGMAAKFAAQGAKNLHVVDLDGARDGRLVNDEIIRTIARDSGLFVQIGGGVRDERRILRYLDSGVGRVILGTAAAEDFAFLERMVGKYGEKIAVSVDARSGRLAVRGWRQTTEVDSFDFCKRLEQAGVRTVIYTDIARDGAMGGPNLAAYRELAELISCDIVASGGIRSMDDIRALRETGLYGAIIGKALYEGAINFKELIAC